MHSQCYQRTVSPARASSALGLYIHFPFCAYKCGYCDFNSWVEKDSEPQRQWLEGIKKETLAWKKLGQLGSVDTLFMGGGTPSLLREDLWDELAVFLKSEFHFTSDLEWTVECNPETITPALLNKLNAIGVNRLSLGIQSFEEKFLKRLERGANPEANRRALTIISQSWPHRWSLDLMFGLPQQSLDEWQNDLEVALSFNPQHISAYQLTLTTEKSKRWQQGTDTELLEFFRVARETLSKHQIFPYEISNFSKSGHECRHNLKYWRAESFLGLGPGAYSLLPPNLIMNSPLGAHFKTPSKFLDWLKWTEAQEFSRAELRDEKMHINELLLLGLRLEDGIEKSQFPPSVDFNCLAPISHLLEFTANSLRPTQRGREILDTTILEASRLMT